MLTGEGREWLVVRNNISASWRIFMYPNTALSSSLQSLHLLRKEAFKPCPPRQYVKTKVE